MCWFKKQSRQCETTQMEKRLRKSTNLKSHFVWISNCYSTAMGTFRQREKTAHHVTNGGEMTTETCVMCSVPVHLTCECACFAIRKNVNPSTFDFCARAHSFTHNNNCFEWKVINAATMYMLSAFHLRWGFFVCVRTAYRSLAAHNFHVNFQISYAHCFRWQFSLFVRSSTQFHLKHGNVLTTNELKKEIYVGNKQRKKANTKVHRKRPHFAIK